MNLAVNARDAMPDGGVLMIEAERVEIDKEYAKTHGYGELGAYALIAITDTGSGMDEQTKAKIFEPFFTTKEIGKGTGLGLSIVYGIIKQHSGYINVYSEIGKGTTFKIYLPLSEKMSEGAISVPESRAITAGKEILLLAEDDVEVRKFTKHILEESGYTVIEAKDGHDAVNKFMDNKDNIRFLLLDVIMPGKNGKDVYHEIRKENPDIKALFISGYTANIIHKKGILEEGVDVILKPVSPTRLLQKIREILDRSV
jgi:CheY-like chemotaxis protein